jgi:hypothetical protein
MKKKRLSPFSVEFWENKGFSKEEALYERNSRRPINWEYWNKRGHSKEDSIELAKKTKADNNAKGTKASASRNMEEMRKTSIRCIEYWMEKGFSEIESLQKVKEVQATNTIEKYASKYGENAEEKFKERNKKWSEKIEEMNPYRNGIDAEKLLKKYGTVEKVCEYLKETRNINAPKTVSELNQIISEDVDENPYIQYYFIEKLVKRYPKIYFDLLKLDPIEFLSVYVVEGGKLHTNQSRGAYKTYRKWLEDGSLLRSSYEIKFFDLLKKYGIENFSVDGFYPNSNMRYDFKVGEVYIEIAPLYGKVQEYSKKMDQKRLEFGAVILDSTVDYEEYVTSTLL